MKFLQLSLILALGTTPALFGSGSSAAAQSQKPKTKKRKNVAKNGAYKADDKSREDGSAAKQVRTSSHQAGGAFAPVDNSLLVLVEAASRAAPADVVAVNSIEALAAATKSLAALDALTSYASSTSRNVAVGGSLASAAAGSAVSMVDPDGDDAMGDVSAPASASAAVPQAHPVPMEDVAPVAPSVAPSASAAAAQPVPPAPAREPLPEVNPDELLQHIFETPAENQEIRSELLRIILLLNPNLEYQTREGKTLVHLGVERNDRKLLEVMYRQNPQKFPVWFNTRTRCGKSPLDLLRALPHAQRETILPWIASKGVNTQA